MVDNVERRTGFAFRLFFLFTIVLFPNAQALSGSEPTPLPPGTRPFERSAFCQQHGCVRILSRVRWDFTPEARLHVVYGLRSNQNIELGLFLNRAGEIRGVLFQTLSLDSWEQEYSLAAQFIRSTFPGIAVDTAYVRAFSDGWFAGWDRLPPQVQWRGHPMIIARQQSFIPSFSQVKYDGISVGIGVSGGQ